jgi:hypothetical protein
MNLCPAASKQVPAPLSNKAQALSASADELKSCRRRMASEIHRSDATCNSSLKTRLAFHLWRALLLVSFATFALGLSGHITALIAAPWLSLRTQVAIHATIPVILTSVKFVTVPLLVLLTPFAHRHADFKAWERWSKTSFNRLERELKFSCCPVKALFLGIKLTWLRCTAERKSRGAD